MMGKVIMSGIVPQLVAPVTGVALADIAEGSIVKLNENGAPVEFYVAKHNYESGLNGTGRTLLVRKDCHSKPEMWGSTQLYANNTLDTYLNGTYKAVLDADIHEAIATTKFYYTPGNGNNALSTLERAVWQLSAAEYGYTDGNYNVEGATLPISNTLRVAYYNGTAVPQWTRTPLKGETGNAPYVAIIMANGAFNSSGYSGRANYCRPAFTLPSTALFDEETLLFKGVS